MATITNYNGNTFELRSPSGDFVCHGPLAFCVYIASSNGWSHVCR